MQVGAFWISCLHASYYPASLYDPHIFYHFKTALSQSSGGASRQVHLEPLLNLPPPNQAPMLFHTSAGSTCMAAVLRELDVGPVRTLHTGLQGCGACTHARDSENSLSHVLSALPVPLLCAPPHLLSATFSPSFVHTGEVSCSLARSCLTASTRAPVHMEPMLSMSTSLLVSLLTWAHSKGGQGSRLRLNAYNSSCVLGSMLYRRAAASLNIHRMIRDKMHSRKRMAEH